MASKGDKTRNNHNDNDKSTASSIRLADIFPLTDEQKELFLQDGILVVDNILSEEEISATQQGLHNTLRKCHGVDHNDLQHTAQNLLALSSTNGSGGVLDIYYPCWKMKVATNLNLLSVVSQLWEIGFHNEHDTVVMDEFKRHPYGSFDVNKAYIYIDRVGYRIPTKVSENIIHENDASSADNKSKKQQLRNNNKRRSIQRSLTPHLDCCPQTILENKHDGSNVSKWRPLQSFVSLTNNMEPNTGGFEAAPGFHRQFNQWARNRPQPSSGNKKKGGGQEDEMNNRVLCVGQYTHIRPVEDKDVLSQIKHIPCCAGSAVIWDYRIPHGNSYRNDSDVTREVVYASFLPDVKVNRIYVQNQLQSYQERKMPTDQWVLDNRRSTCIDLATSTCDCDNEQHINYSFNAVGKKLMGMEDW